MRRPSSCWVRRFVAAAGACALLAMISAPGAIAQTTADIQSAGPLTDIFITQRHRVPGRPHRRHAVRVLPPRRQHGGELRNRRVDRRDAVRAAGIDRLDRAAPVRGLRLGHRAGSVHGDDHRSGAGPEQRRDAAHARRDRLLRGRQRVLSDRYDGHQQHLEPPADQALPRRRLLPARFGLRASGSWMRPTGPSRARRPRTIRRPS